MSNNKYFKYLKSPRLMASVILMTFFKWLPDITYIKILYYFRTGKRLNLKDPKTFTEKLQWLKLYNRRPEYSILVDKLTVKEHISKIIGKEYIIPTIGVWDYPEDIDISSLPNKFVLKTTNGGGGKGVIICRDKNHFDLKDARQQLNHALRDNIFRKYREWPYKNVSKRIIAEQLLEPHGNQELQDYKFFCFNGEPKVMLISHGRFTEKGVCFDYYDMDFNKLPFEQGGPNSGINMEKPKGFEKMKELASILSEGMPHVRVDFYNIDGDIYFGELTFFDSSGMAKFNPEKWNRIFGDWITLPEKII